MPRDGKRLKLLSQITPFEYDQETYLIIRRTLDMGRINLRIRGFSLIDLVLTLATTSIILAISVPNFKQLLVDSRFRRQLSLVHARLEKYILEARQLEQEVTIQFKDQEVTARVTSGQIHLIESLALPNNIGLKDAATITISNSGVVTPKTITFVSAYHQCSLVVSLRGRIREVCL